YLFQRATPRGRFRTPDRISPERRSKLFSLSRLSVPQHHASWRQTILPRLSRWSQRRPAIRPRFAPLRRQSRSASFVAAAAPRSLSRFRHRLRRNRTRNFPQALLRLRLRPHPAGPRRLRFPRLLRTSSALPPKRSLCVKESSLALAQRRIARPASDPHRGVRKHARLRKIAQYRQ